MTRTKKSSPDMFNFYVLLGGQKKSVTPAGFPHAGSYAKHHHLKQKVQKTKDIPKIWVLMGKQFEDFRTKKRTETFFSTFHKTPVGHQDPKAIN